jgi:hypothetical protein
MFSATVEDRMVQALIISQPISFTCLVKPDLYSMILIFHEHCWSQWFGFHFQHRQGRDILA